MHFKGEKTLLNRPLKGAREMLEPFGVRLENEGGGAKADGTPGEGDATDQTAAEAKIPLAALGRLTPAKAEISGAYGSQIVSGLLMSLPLTDGSSSIRLTNPKSIPYIFITIDVLKRFGIKIGNEMEGDADFAGTGDLSHCDAINFHIRGGQRFHPADIDIEGDWSAAANLLAAGAVFGRTEVAGLDTKSLQADISIMDVLMDAGASLSEDNGTHVIHCQKAPLSPFEVDAGNCPDLFPVIAVLAAFCEGRSSIAGVGRLSGKESDRAGAITSMLTQMGVGNSIRGDVLTVDGHSLARRCLTGNLIHGGAYTSHHDHRMVMAIMIASLGADGPVTIDDTECVAKSFPEFMEVFRRLASA
jgi:3-phosphoshikimate 1-carboxyvinyltransferase